MLMIPQSNVTRDEITSHKLTYVDREVSVLDASRLMRKAGTAELLVTGQADGMLRPLGIVTARDIVTRVIAAELDPAVLTAGDIAWSGKAAADPADGDAERLLRYQENHCGALAVLDGDGRLVGTVKLDEFIGPLGCGPGVA
jgi:CBS domain-containing protein